MAAVNFCELNLVANTETMAQGDRDGSTGGKVAVISQAEISCGRLKEILPELPVSTLLPVWTGTFQESEGRFGRLSGVSRSQTRLLQV